MAALEAALRHILIKNAAVAKILEERVYPLSVEKPSVPFVVYEVRGGEDDFTRSGYSGLMTRRVTITCVATPYDAAVALAEAVKSALPLWGAKIRGVDSGGGTFEEVWLRMIRRDDERDYNAAGNGAVTPVGRQLDYTIKFTITT